MITILGIALVSATVVSGCGGGGQSRLIDERHGTFAGLGIGDSSKRVERVFGEPDSRRTGGIAPVGHDFVDIGGPASVAIPCGPRRPNHKQGPRPVWLPPDLRYEDVSFLVCHWRVYAVLVAEERAVTKRGVAIGDDLDRAKAAYPGLSCRHAYGGESLFGGENTYPYCAGRIGSSRWIWFGEDPIASITVSSTRLGLPVG